ncbi:MAG TPA: hypothetical protein VGG57_19235 [Stellaceae bacterium]|jgi:hypothetical protein
MSPRLIGWIAVAIAAVAVVIIGGESAGTWRALGASEISLAGWVAMGLGVLFSLALGVGLMALVFFSNRRGYDDQDRNEPE